MSRAWALKATEPSGHDLHGYIFDSFAEGQAWLMQEYIDIAAYELWTVDVREGPCPHCGCTPPRRVAKWIKRAWRKPKRLRSSGEGEATT